MIAKQITSAGAAIIQPRTLGANEHCDAAPKRSIYCDRLNVLAVYAGCALMAPMAVHSNHSLKRTSSVAQFDGPAAKKLNRGPIRHHKAAWDLQREQRCNATVLNDRDAQSLLTRSIGLALEAVGFEAAAPDAIESFRGDVEECMTDYAPSGAVQVC